MANPSISAAFFLPNIGSLSYFSHNTHFTFAHKRSNDKVSHHHADAAVPKQKQNPPRYSTDDDNDFAGDGKTDIF